ncbi:MAG: hypothetical protein ACLQLC_07900 [Candidatus Sulfotelmatobacter sp.]
MIRLLVTTLLLVGLVAAGAPAQDTPSAPASNPATPPVNDSSHQQAATVPDGMPSRELSGKVGLVRGVVKRLDPIHDQLVIHSFGGGDLKVNFDPRTQLLPENEPMLLTSMPAGSVVSVDTVMENGKLFARSVRTNPSGAIAVELNGQVVRYNASKSELTLRDPLTPDNISLRITPGTIVVKGGQQSSAQALSDGMLVRVFFSPAEHVANNVEILAARGSSFTFEGRILSVDFRSRTVALSNDTDQSIRELSFDSLDPNTARMLREGARVNIQAEFDGDRYNVRKVSPTQAK